MKALLQVGKLRAGYGAVEVLHGIGLRVEAGEAVAVLGPNGAGKSTLLRTLSGLVRAAAGEILLDGAPIHALPAHRIVGAAWCRCPRLGTSFPT